MAFDLHRVRSALTDTETSSPTPAKKNKSAFGQLQPAGPLFGADEKLNNMVFKLLSNHSSVCLGLTCKKLYKIHRCNHPEILKLSEAPDFYDPGINDPSLPKSLHVLLGDWLGSDLIYCSLAEKFIYKFLVAPVDHSNDELMSLDELDKCVEGFWDGKETNREESLEVIGHNKRQRR